jgi:hypothetical protein
MQDDKPAEPTVTSSPEAKTLRGWGVVRMSPWRFVGLFSNPEAAQSKARAMGPEYQAHYGAQRAGTDDFVWADEGEVATTNDP